VRRRAPLPALLLAGLALAPGAPARADEGVARRLAALRSLVAPPSARAAAAAPRAEPGCPAGAWWRATGYGLRSRTEAAIRDAALRFAVAPALIRAVIRHESAFDPDAVSHKGAQGMMQLMPGTSRALGVVCPFDPRENILAGTRYLRRLYDRFGSWSRALAGYHAGPGRVEAGRLPGETRRYVDRVLRSWDPQRFTRRS
jgi:soluble lytic murein transglycosylase-like protein